MPENPLQIPDNPRLPAVPDNYRWRIEVEPDPIGEVRFIVYLDRAIPNDFFQRLAKSEPMWKTINVKVEHYYPPEEIKYYQKTFDSPKDAIFSAAESLYHTHFGTTKKTYPPNTYTAVEMED